MPGSIVKSDLVILKAVQIEKQAFEGRIRLVYHQIQFKKFCRSGFLSKLNVNKEDYNQMSLKGAQLRGKNN